MTYEHVELPEWFTLFEAEAHGLVERRPWYFHLAVTYQPPGRYWPLQWSETAIFLTVALASSGLSGWWVRRRLA